MLYGMRPIQLLIKQHYWPLIQVIAIFSQVMVRKLPSRPMITVKTLALVMMPQQI